MFQSDRGTNCVLPHTHQMSSPDHGSVGKEAQEEMSWKGFCTDEEADDSAPSDESSEEVDDGVKTGTNGESPEADTSEENRLDGGIIRIVPGEPVWTGQELHILGELKDRWFRGKAEEQKAVVEEAVNALNNIQPRDTVTMRRKVQKWLKRRAGKRNNYGPGNRPSLQTVLAYYKEAEVTATVLRKYGIVPTGKKGPFLGLWKKELGLLQRALKTDPAMKEEYERLEATRGEWTTKGPPRERRQRYVKNIPCWDLGVEIETQDGGKESNENGHGVRRTNVL
jgi:hypothetical protein